MELHASALALAYWCHSQLISATKGIKAEDNFITKKGREKHDNLLKFHLENYPPLRKLFKKLEPYKTEEGFVRKYKEFNLCGTPDWFAFRSRGRISILENKTITSRKAGRFRLPQARFQVEAYCFIMNPIFKELGYKLHDEHKIFYFYQRTMEPLEIHTVFYEEGVFLKKLDKVLQVIRGKMNPIPPRNWKCHACDKIYRENCAFINLREAPKQYDPQLKREVQHLLEERGHYLVDGSRWMNRKGSYGLIDFLCINCGKYFEFTTFESGFLRLRKNLELYEKFDVLFFTFTDQGIKFAESKDLKLALKFIDKGEYFLVKLPLLLKPIKCEVEK